MEFYSLQSLHDFFSPVQLFLCCVDCWHKFLCPQPANTALFILPSFPVPNPLCTISGDVPRRRIELSSLLGHSSILLGLTKNPTGISHLKSEFNVHKCTLHNLQNITFSEIKIRTINVLDCQTPPPPPFVTLPISSFIHTTMECTDDLFTEPLLQPNMNNLMSPHIRAFLCKKEWKSEGRNKLSKKIDTVLWLTQFSFVMFQSSCILNY